MKIKNIFAREVLDSRGNPTVEAEVTLEDGSCGKFSVPSGASTGKYEAVELRDGGERYDGLGVQKAVSNVNEIIKTELEGSEFDQESLDKKMITLDGTDNKAILGANAILAVSVAFCKVQAISQKESLYKYIQKLSKNDKLVLPKPMVLIIEGGKHADQSSDFQEFMVIAKKVKAFKEALRMSSEIYHKAGEILQKEGLSIDVGFEGAYGPSLKSNEKVFQVIEEAIAKAGYKSGEEIEIAIDSAASELLNSKGEYELKTEGKQLTSDELIEYYSKVCAKYPISLIEDGLAQDDWDGWKKLNEKLGSKIQIVGDDLTVTNVKRIKEAIEEKAINSVLIKINQIGTIWETLEAIKFAKANDFSIVVSHRSGETEDSFIADFAVGVGAEMCKFGAPARSERDAKYNQLLRIEEEITQGSS